MAIRAQSVMPSLEVTSGQIVELPVVGALSDPLAHGKNPRVRNVSPMRFPRSRLLAAAVIALGAASACGPDPWEHKAVANITAASQIVGGFSYDEQRLYSRGLEHIAKRHLQLGTFTISQVIDTERDREAAMNDQRAAAAERLAALKKKRQDAAIAAGERSDVAAILKIPSENDTLARAIRAYSVDGDTLTLTLDEDYWDSLSGQDKDLFKQSIWGAWQVAYKRRTHDPDAHVTLNLQNLAGSSIGSYY